MDFTSNSKIWLVTKDTASLERIIKKNYAPNIIQNGIYKVKVTKNEGNENKHAINDR